CCDTYDSWTRSTDVARLAEPSGVIVVMPDGGRAGFYSDWWNGGQLGPPARGTFHLDELRAGPGRDYPAGDGRVIAGLSMGGLGAFCYAARRPGMFAAAAAFSGPLHTTYSALDGFGGPEGIAYILTSQGEDPLGPWGDVRQQPGVWAEHNPY